MRRIHHRRWLQSLISGRETLQDGTSSYSTTATTSGRLFVRVSTSMPGSAFDNAYFFLSNVACEIAEFSCFE